MSEQKYYVFQKSVDGKKIVSQLVRCKFMSENAEFVPVIQSESGRYENSFSEFTKIELAKIGNSALYKRADYCEFMELPQDWVMNDKTYKWLCEWINPLIELVPVEEEKMREKITDLIDDLEGRVNYAHDGLEKALDLLKKGDADSCSSELEDILENLKELSKELY